MDQANIYNRINGWLGYDELPNGTDTHVPNRKQYWWDTDWDTAQIKLPMLLCPSDPQLAVQGQIPGMHGWCSDASNGVGCTSTGGIWGSDWWLGDNPEVGVTNYLPAGGVLGGRLENSWSRYGGIFASGSKTRFRDITDGSSNTVAFWEVTGGDDWNYYWIDNGAFPSGWGFAESDAPGTPSRFNKLGSLHTGGTQALMGDGSVRFVSENIDATQWNGVLHSVAASGDGNVIGEF